ncbi:hypothetical protein Clacol_008701 [Clathrus columnatus]|uniref:Uncharacterized protein n=1 Tax=Clathrus columnatus TaxID=1419009 RepID=A0AAV5AL05_9AGAM|nr:hypothetical protein Clacol_008701 [Clathrus columnatus]
MSLSGVLSRARKQPFYGDISLSGRFEGSSYKAEPWLGDVYLRRRSSARQASMEEVNIANQVDQSPCARLLKNYATNEQHPSLEQRHHLSNIPNRPARMWGPRANVNSKTAIQPPRTISRTISFWKRTSAVALKYSDAPGDNVYHSNEEYQTPATATRQGQRRPLPQLPLLRPPVNRNHVDVDSIQPSHVNPQTMPPINTISESVASIRSASRPTATGTEPLQLRSTILNNQYYRTRPSSTYSRSEASSNSILYTPKSFLSEVSHLGMDVLRAAVVDLKSTALDFYIDRAATMLDSGDHDTSVVRNSIAASTIITSKDTLGDPYTRVQKILERAYLNTSPQLGQSI